MASNREVKRDTPPCQPLSLALSPPHLQARVDGEECPLAHPHSRPDEGTRVTLLDGVPLVARDSRELAG